jgi:hypothetical protein
MKKLLSGTMLLAMVIAVPIPTMAGVNISVNFPLPPPIVFAAPPSVIVLPETDDVYVDPDIDVDLFFWNGWWWRPWEGRWYRSRYYDYDWVYYDYVPAFYFSIDPGWRGCYRDHDWHGHPWRYERIPHQQLRDHWRGWHQNGYWQKQETWNVRGYKAQPRPQVQEQRRQREQEYRQRPEVQQHQQQRQQQQRQPQVHQPQHSQPQGKPGGGKVEHKD